MTFDYHQRNPILKVDVSILIALLLVRSSSVSSFVKTYNTKRSIFVSHNQQLHVFDKASINIPNIDATWRDDEDSSHTLATIAPRKRCNDENLLESTLGKIEYKEIAVPPYVSSSEKAMISYLHWPPLSSLSKKKKKKMAAVSLSPFVSAPLSCADAQSAHICNDEVVILIPGFDSCCLEFRHLGRLLSSYGYDVFAPDILGWGFSGLKDIADFSASAKVDALVSFLLNIVAARKNHGDGQPNQQAAPGLPNAIPATTTCTKVNIVGTSLGAAFGLELCSRIGMLQKEKEHNETTAHETLQQPKDLVEIGKVVWISPQLFIDGTILKFLPIWYIKFLVKLLKIAFFRRVVEFLCVYDKVSFLRKSISNDGTSSSSSSNTKTNNNDDGDFDDVTHIWEQLSSRDGWEDALLSYIKSGGLAPTKTIKHVRDDIPTLIISGSNDVLFNAQSSEAKRLNNKLLRKSTMVSINKCGHYAHLEKPKTTASTIIKFFKQNRDE